MAQTAVICDDDPIARQVIERLAMDAKYEVVAEADNAVHAIEIVNYAKPSVLVMDVSMPGMNGIDALEAVREKSPETRVILVSAFDVLPDHAKASGAYAVIDKTDFEQLADVLAGITNLSGV